MSKYIFLILITLSFNANSLECFIIDPSDTIKLKTLDDLVVKLPEYIKQSHPLFTETESYKSLLDSIKELRDKDNRKNIDLNEFIIKNYLLVRSIAYNLNVRLNCSLKDDSIQIKEKNYEI
jgi:hypothetical protein